MIIDDNIIDNKNKQLAVFLNQILTLEPNTNMDIATAFFNVEGYSLLKENLQGLNHFRLLLGKTPELTSNNDTLGKILLRDISNDVATLDLSAERQDDISTLIKFLEKSNVEIRIYDKNFLHGKVFVFDKLVVSGSSNFTKAGLTREGEYNTVQQGKMPVTYTRETWFNKFWKDSLDFKDDLITLLKNSRFGTTEYTPFQIYIKALYELQKNELIAEMDSEKNSERGMVTNVELSEFQKDAVQRVYSRLRKYGAVIVADSVGLGKTYIALKVLEEFGFVRRKRYLVICPAQLKDTMWLPELKDKILPENILTQENLASKDFIDKAKKATGDHLGEVELIIVDESHNLRNPLSNRWENLNTLIELIAKEKGDKPRIMFMTATPINNTIWDIYNQIMLLVMNDKAAFIKENIPDLQSYFKEIDKKGDPTLLNDLLNEISIRRTRDYIKKEYPDATIHGQKITFPERYLETINYKLDDAYQGMYKQLAEIISTKLTMAYYRILSYKKEELQGADEILALNRMIAIGGIFKTILLKRLESSIEAFRISILHHVKFLQRLISTLESGRILSKQAYRQYLKFTLSMEDDIDEQNFDIEDIMEHLDRFDLSKYNKENLFSDINQDILLLKSIIDRIKFITPDKDAKLVELKNRLLLLHNKNQIVIFTYYKDTLDYIYRYISTQREFKNIQVRKISGSGDFSPKERQKIIDDLKNGQIDILMSTDVLSEGQNLQTAQILINYDLHWNPTRMIQRAGRIDRIGSKFKKIFIYNFFPEDELEDLLRLVNILQDKIIKIDKSVGLDSTVLGETIHPKVFGIIRKIRDCNLDILSELETDSFGGGELFYQPIKNYLKNKSVAELNSLPDGIHSGLSNKKIRGIFFYYQYASDFHFWYLYNLDDRVLLKHKTEILAFISCSEKTPRIIPNFFTDVYTINKLVLAEIEQTYKDIESKEKTDTQLVFLSKEKSTKFIGKLVKELDHEVENYLLDFPEDKSIEKEWETVRVIFLNISITKKRTQILRKLWSNYRRSPNWKRLIRELNDFVADKFSHEHEELEEFNFDKLRLICLDFIS